MRMLTSALALAFLVGPAFGEDKDKLETKSNVREGWFVKAEANKLTVKEKDGKEHVYDLEANPTVTQHGKSTNLDSLKRGVWVSATLGTNNKVTKVEAIDVHEGTFVKAEDNKLYMKHDDGKEHVHEMIKDTPVTCDGKSCKAGDLKVGTKIRVTMNTDKKVSKIDGFTK